MKDNAYLILFFLASGILATAFGVALYQILFWMDWFPLPVFKDDERLIIKAMFIAGVYFSIVIGVLHHILIFSDSYLEFTRKHRKIVVKIYIALLAILGLRVAYYEQCKLYECISLF